GHALRDLRAGRTLGRVTEVLGGAGRRQPDRRRRARDDAAAEAVAAVRHQLLALVDAGLRLRRRQRALRRVRRRVRLVVRAARFHAARLALELPHAAVVTHAGVAVEEAVLLARVDVVARDARRERALVVVQRADALRIVVVDLAVAVVVDAVAALGLPDRD